MFCFKFRKIFRTNLLSSEHLKTSFKFHEYHDEHHRAENYTATHKEQFTTHATIIIKYKTPQKTE